jgi:hypothetical protein
VKKECFQVKDHLYLFLLGMILIIYGIKHKYKLYSYIILSLYQAVFSVKAIDVESERRYLFILTGEVDLVCE